MHDTGVIGDLSWVCDVLEPFKSEQDKLVMCNGFETKTLKGPRAEQLLESIVHLVHGVQLAPS